MGNFGKASISERKREEMLAISSFIRFEFGGGVRKALRRMEGD